MRFFSSLIAAAAVCLAGKAMAVPVTAQPGGIQDLILDADSLLNATAPPPSNLTHSQPAILSTQRLELSFLNKYNAPTLNAYVTGLDRNGRLVLLTPGGSWFYPSAGGSSTPQPIKENCAIMVGKSKTIFLPDYISSGRVWLAYGALRFYTVQIPGNSGPSLVVPSASNPNDPSSGIAWGFIELTNGESGIYANLSYVDFVGLLLGMTLSDAAGQVQTVGGLRYGSLSSICSALTAQSARDGRLWKNLCVRGYYGNLLRILSPTLLISQTPSAFETYWTDYVNRVWTTFTSKPLTIDTQAVGKTACRVSGGLLRCSGDNRGYAKPTAADIFGCNSGPFAIEASDNAVHRAVVPRLCAAFHRQSFYVAGGALQPNMAPYYTGNTMNYYSKIVHAHEVANRGYGFSYDDVAATGRSNPSGLLTAASPKVLTITVGGA